MYLIITFIYKKEHFLFIFVQIFFWRKQINFFFKLDIFGKLLLVRIGFLARNWFLMATLSTFLKELGNNCIIFVIYSKTE